MPTQPNGFPTSPRKSAAPTGVGGGANSILFEPRLSDSSGWEALKRSAALNKHRETVIGEGAWADHPMGDFLKAT